MDALKLESTNKSRRVNGVAREGGTAKAKVDPARPDGDVQARSKILDIPCKGHTDIERYRVHTCALLSATGGKIAGRYQEWLQA